MAIALDKLAPGFLIAAPILRDPNFARTVVLMCLHNDEGALGLVVNRPAPMTLDEILAQLELKSTVALDQNVMVGGPVGLDTGMLLYRCDADEPCDEHDIIVCPELRLTSSRAVLDAIARGAGPGKYLMFLGHSGWAPNQLEQEMSQGAWIPGDLNLDLIFDTPVERRWDQALRDEGLHPAQVGFFRPQA